MGVGGNSIICQIGWLRERGSFAEILVETWVTSQCDQRGIFQTDIRVPEGEAGALAGRLRVGPTPAVRGFRRRADDAIGQYRLFANPIALRLAVIRTAGYP